MKIPWWFWELSTITAGRGLVEKCFVMIKIIVPTPHQMHRNILPPPWTHEHFSCPPPIAKLCHCINTHIWGRIFQTVFTASLWTFKNVVAPFKLRFHLYVYVYMYMHVCISISHQDRLEDIKCFHSYVFIRVWKDPMSPKSAISNYGDLPDWQPHYLVWFLSHDMLFYWIKWAKCHLQPCALFFIVVTPHTQRCVDYYSLITCWCHHTILGHIYDVTTFQTIVMLQVALWHHHIHCLLLVLSWHHCWCH